MKQNLLMLLTFFIVCSAKAQESNPFPPLDSSPVDIVYYPLNSAKVKEGKPLVKVTYSRPHKKGRVIFGGLEQYGKVWRVGANESSEIRFYSDATIGKKKIKAGIYSLFAIPEKDNWVFIINNKTDSWGAYSYDQKNDIVRVKVPVEKVSTPLEDLSITFKDQNSGTDLVLSWDEVQVELPIKFN